MVVPAAYVFLLRGRRRGGTEVLLQLRQNTGYMDDHWAAAAAGHVERGETAYDAARREAAEEIGVDDLDLEFVTSMQRTQQRRADRRADRLLLHRAVAGPASRGSSSPTKCADLRWCPLDALPDPVVPHELQVLQAAPSGYRAGVHDLRLRLERRQP